jgi:phytoene dehydrogenase-like protein
MIEDLRDETRHADVIVVGGGLAGLTAATLIAGAGRSVVLLERAAGLGGRAATRSRDGIRFNLGPHALHRHGDAFRLLKGLGVRFTGRPPDASGGGLYAQDVFYLLPAGILSLVRSRFLTLRDKWRLVRLLAGLPRLDIRAVARVALRDWVVKAAGKGALAGLLLTLRRVSTYADDPGRLSAGAALDQLRLALAGNVWYLDGGWETLVDGLRDQAVASGSEVRTGARAEAVADDGDAVTVRLAGGGVLRGRAVVLAVGPDDACRLLGSPDDAPLARWAAGRVPVRASCLDVALAWRPRPGHRVAFGVDRPLYNSVHSAVAQLAPEGVAVVRVAKYLGGGDVAEERELEGFLDRLQPGWRAHVVARRFLPGMTVAHALPTADCGGLGGRPPVAVDGCPNVFLAGDWVGGRGMLADASAASAEEAAGRAIDALRRPPNGPVRRPARVGR